jgi:hypothetical protein
MIFRLRPAESSVVRPRVTPDPQRAAELQRRIESLRYQPESGFHRDRTVVRQDDRRGLQVAGFN